MLLAIIFKILNIRFIQLTSSVGVLLGFRFNLFQFTMFPVRTSITLTFGKTGISAMLIEVERNNGGTVHYTLEVGRVSKLQTNLLNVHTAIFFLQNYIQTSFFPSS